jgi:hypothetical protein
MPCCNCARRSVPWSRAEYYERACNQCLQRNQKFKIKQASQQNTALNSSEKNLFPLGQLEGISRTVSRELMSPPLTAMPHHAVPHAHGHPLSPLNGNALMGALTLAPAAHPSHGSNGGEGAHVSFADMSPSRELSRELSSSDNHQANNGGYDEPPPRYDVKDEPKAFTHEHM